MLGFKLYDININIICLIYLIYLKKNLWFFNKYNILNSYDLLKGDFN